MLGWNKWSLNCPEKYIYRRKKVFKFLSYKYPLFCPLIRGLVLNSRCNYWSHSFHKSKHSKGWGSFSTSVLIRLALASKLKMLVQQVLYLFCYRIGSLCSRHRRINFDRWSYLFSTRSANPRDFLSKSAAPDLNLYIWAWSCQ